MPTLFDWKVAWPNQTRKQLLRMQLDRAEGGREGVKDVSTTNKKNTYNRFNKARESKMPGGSSVRSLPVKSLKPTRNKVYQIVRIGSISYPIAHHHH